MRLALCALALLIAARPAFGQASRVRITIMGHRAPVIVDSMASVFSVGASRATAFHAAAQVMLELGIAVDTRDSLRGTVGVANAPHMRRFVKSPISRFLNCGIGLLGSNADNYRVWVTAFAFVDGADSTTSRLRVAMIGGARDIQGSSTEPVPCGSTGTFETMFAERVRLRIASGAP